MAASMQTYDSWLTERLLQLNPDTDTDVFVSYITGILEEDVPKEEKMESMTEFISQVVEEHLEAVCDELYKKWEQCSGISQEQKEKAKDADKLTDHLATILEKQKIEVIITKEKTAEEIARKQAILSQYREVASGDEDEDSGNEDSGGHASGKGDNFDFQNTNSDLVKQIELEKREKSKQDSEKKKEKDKQEREAQKQKKTDRKDQEKKRTQKGEKRR